MSAQDMFCTPKEARVTKRRNSQSRGSTPTQSPSRSVQRRPSNPRPRTRKSYSQVQEKRDTLNILFKNQTQPNWCNQQLQKLHEEQRSLWEPFGILPARKEKTENFVTSSSPQTMQLSSSYSASQEISKPVKASSWCFYILIIGSITFFSIGAWYLYLNQDYITMRITDFYSPKEPSQSLTPYSQESEQADHCRSLNIYMEKFGKYSRIVSKLQKELDTIKQQVRKSEVILPPSKSPLEELFPEEPDLVTSGNGGYVVATPDTDETTVPLVIPVLPGIWSYTVHTTWRPASTAISGIVQGVGDCWSFNGQSGRLVLGLKGPSHLTSVSLTHIPANMLVTRDRDSAPRHFQVLAHFSKEDLDNGLLLGEFEYNKSGYFRQTFDLDPQVVLNNLFSLVEFRFLSNHNNPNYTCIYRVHVHGHVILNY